MADVTRNIAKLSTLKIIFVEFNEEEIKQGNTTHAQRVTQARFQRSSPRAKLTTQMSERESA